MKHGRMKTRSLCKKMVLCTQLHYPDKRPRLRVRDLDERHDVREASDRAVLDVGRGLALVVRRLDPVLVGHHFLVRTPIEQQRLEPEGLRAAEVARERVADM